MFGRFTNFEILCDAPAYGIVRAYEESGFDSPLDVRWCRMSHFLNGDGRRTSVFADGLWQWLFAKHRTLRQTCTCGLALPDLKKYEFSFFSEKVGEYLLGQCRRCKTVFWDEAVPLPAWMEEGEVG